MSFPSATRYRHGWEATESGTKAFKVNKYYRTDWMLEDELTLEIERLNIDAVWDNFMNEQIKADDRKEKLRKDIEKLAKQARSEKQPSKKVLLASQIKALKKRLTELEY